MTSLLLSLLRDRTKPTSVVPAAVAEQKEEAQAPAPEPQPVLQPQPPVLPPKQPVTGGFGFNLGEQVPVGTELRRSSDGEISAVLLSRNEFSPFNDLILRITRDGRIFEITGQAYVDSDHSGILEEELTRSLIEKYGLKGTLRKPLGDFGVNRFGNEHREVSISEMRLTSRDEVLIYLSYADLDSAKADAEVTARAKRIAAEKTTKGLGL